ncbi:MAG: hypothetical protein QNJ30_18130 [Kiloniellales bacterium]|nr:hypothetical protein [Kiloniellales bacterium]
MAIESLKAGRPSGASPPPPPKPVRPKPKAATGEGLRLDLIVKDLLRNWHFLLAGGALALLAALTVVNFKGPTYTASMIVAPITDDALNKVQFYGNSYSFSDDSPLLSGFGGGQPEEFERFIVLLHTHRVAEILEQKHQVGRILFSPLWDQERQAWNRPGGLAFRAKALARSLFGYPDWEPPRAKEVQVYLRKNLDVSPLSRGAMRSVSLSGKDPEHLAQILLWLFEETSALMREERNASLSNNINYLQDRLGQSRIDIYRESLISLLADQERELMLSQTEQPYGAVLLEAPVPPLQPSGLEPLILLTAASLGGLGLAALLVLSVTLPRRRLAQADRQRSATPRFP